MKAPFILALTGNPRTGKDTLANLLVEYDECYRVAFADPLYEEIAAAFGVEVSKLASTEWKSHTQPELQPRLSRNREFMDVCKHLGYFRDEAMTSRQVLQVWGTEYRRRSYGEDFYAKQIVDKLSGAAIPVVSDLREYVELSVLLQQVNLGKTAHVVVIQISREGVSRTSHASDKGISPLFVDFTVENNSTELDMYTKVKAELHDRGYIK